MKREFRIPYKDNLLGNMVACSPLHVYDDLQCVWGLGFEAHVICIY